MSGGDVDMRELLHSIADLAVAVVPSCVGVSITIMGSAGPLTMTATSDDLALLDATQYLDGGPCLECGEHGEDLYVPDLLDEKRWHAAAQVAAAHGVRSSLSMPLRDGDTTVGALNVYASEPDSFDKKERLVAGIFGAHVEEVVANADLSFMTREFARELPDRLAAAGRLDEAVGMLMARQGWTAAEARERLTEAAGRAGVSASRLAEVLIDLTLGP